MGTPPSSPLPSCAPWAGLLASLLILGAPLLAQTSADLAAQGRRAREEGRLDAAEDLFRRASLAEPSAPAPVLLLAETIAWQKRFDEAESVYRAAIERFGASRDARLGLGRVLLWKGKYGEARRILSTVLATTDDVDAREELARAFYWSGDFRAAEREFARVLARDPSREESRRALAEIRSGATPAYALRTAHRTDDQPFEVDRAEVEVALFSDPLTRWDVSAGAWTMDDPSESAPFVGIRAETTLPAARITIAPSIRLLSFPDGEEELLGGLRISKKILGSSALSIAANRHELLLNREAMDDHPFVTDLSLEYDLASPSGRMGRVRAGSSRYFDGNEGVFADAYFLTPTLRRSGVVVSLGIAASYRDTEQPRFRVERASGAPLAPGRWRYEWEGVYDPYWTPIDLEEVRAIASVGSAPGSRILWSLQVTGGAARDTAIGFVPRSGPTPLPQFSFEVGFERTYRPWTASASAEIPIASATRVRFDYEHMTTVYYEADELRATLVGRF